jgi:hypothetical protein
VFLMGECNKVLINLDHSFNGFGTQDNCIYEENRALSMRFVTTTELHRNEAAAQNTRGKQRRKGEGADLDIRECVCERERESRKRKKAE